MPQVEKPGLSSYDDAARRSQRQTTGHNARSSGVSPDGLGRAWVVTVATAASTVVFIVLHRVQINVILPFQQEKLGVDWTSLPMISLVHGLRVILAWMFGWYGVLILAPSMIYLTLQINGFAMPPAHHLILMAVLLTSAPFSFSVMEVFGVAARAEQDRQYWWRAILLVGTVSSVINGIAVHLFWTFAKTGRLETVLSLLTSIFAGVFGLVVLALVLLVMFRKFTPE